MTIEKFQKEYRFLSNFQPARVVFEHAVYPSVENAYQAAKTTNLVLRVAFQTTYTAGQAKRSGRELFLRSDWEEIKLDVMLELLRQKYKNEPLRTRLLQTCDQELIESNTWNDTFWGVCRGIGKNHLGKLTMKVRQEIVES